MVSRALFAESMKSLSMRRFASVAIYDNLLLWRPWWCALKVDLNVDVLTVHLWLWWPWVLVPFSLPWLWLSATWRVHRGLRKLQIPMRVVHVRVGLRRKRPKRK